MGQWGYTPMEGDNGSAVVDKVRYAMQDAAEKAITRRSRDPHEMWDALASVQYIMLLPPSYHQMALTQEIVYPALEKIDLLLADEEWLSEWRDGGRATRAYLKKLKRQLETLSIKL